MHERVAGIDVHKDMIKVAGAGVTHVVMEASGVYTKPVYHAPREQDFTEVMVVKPQACQGAERT
jgi:transposase